MSVIAKIINRKDKLIKQLSILVFSGGYHVISNT